MGRGGDAFPFHTKLRNKDVTQTLPCNPDTLLYQFIKACLVTYAGIRSESSSTGISLPSGAFRGISTNTLRNGLTSSTPDSHVRITVFEAALQGFRTRNEGGSGKTKRLEILSNEVPTTFELVSPPPAFRG